MKRNESALFQKKELPLNGNSHSKASLENHLEALTVLSQSLLREIEALKKSEDVVLTSRIDLDEEVKRFEEHLIRCALLRTGGKQRKAAQLLNVKANTLNSKIKRYGIDLNGIDSNGLNQPKPQGLLINMR